ncbi:ATP-binding protein [Microterricola pindariensis]|uniref:ATP-binding protein n=1 Tax=Microterricola pindariensis TaxID=478010 RepID=A0ABX5AZM6_9MICO|nr:ATP-binding protein [Microterricola pindariensis]PPL19809.1 hypothetical protein GY24_04110 [Microterricola pindariensis]
MSTSILSEDDFEAQSSGKRSAAQQLVDLALDEYNLGVDLDGKAFGVRKGGHIAIPLVGSKRSVRKEVGGLFRRKTRRTASQNALSDAMSALEYEADDPGDPVAPTKLHMRASRTSDDEIFIDLGDATEQVVRVTPDGWEVLNGYAEIPVLFRRTNVTAALPTPTRNGSLDPLWEFVNLPSAADRELITGWLIAAVILIGLPCPILALLGEQGTAKTSSARRIFSLFDPTAAAVRRPPSDADRLLHAGAHSRSVIFDNLSSIPRWLSDGLCRYVTGESDVDRSLYTDDDARIIQVQGVLGFTGIDVGSLAGDLAERCVWGDLEVIPATGRRSERELNAAWDEVYPSMVGGLLDLVVLTLQKLPKVHLAEKPRMADFAEVLAALDLATGSSSLDHYIQAQQSVAEDIVRTDKFLGAIIGKITERWVGTGKELYTLLPRPSDDKFWPEQRGISGKMRRVAPDLRKAGWTVQEIKPDPASKRPKTWILVPPDTHITDAEIATAQFARELCDLDVKEWTERVLADGATSSCAHEHGTYHRMGSDFLCKKTGCTARWRPGYQALVERSKALDARLMTELERLSLTVLAFDQIIADRANDDVAA